MRSISLRLWIPVTVLTLTTLLIAGMSLYQTNIQSNTLKQQHLSDVSHTLIRLQSLIEDALVHQNYSLIEEEISFLGIKTEINFLVLVNPSDKIEISSRYAWKNKPIIHVLPDFNHASVNLALQTTPKIELNPHTQRIQIFFPVRYPQTGQQLRSFSYGFLYLDYDLKPALNNLGYQVLTESGIMWFVCVFLMLILHFILRHFINKPLNHLVQVMKDSTEENFLQSQLKGNGELAVLGENFNQLMHRLLDSQHNLKKQKDLYALLSATNQLMIRTQSQQELFDKVCHLIAERPDFALASIALVNKESQQMEILSKHGHAIDCVDDLNFIINSHSPENQCCPTMTLQKNGSLINNQFQKTQQDKSWHLFALKHNIQSCAAFQITKFGEVLGSFNLYATEKAYFTQEIKALLEEMTTDISYALENFELDEYKQQAEAILLEKEEKLSITLDAIGDGVVVSDEQGKIVRMNPIAETLTGWKLEQAQGHLFSDVFQMIDSHSRQAIKNPISEVLETQKVISISNHTILVSKQGHQHHIADSAAPIFDKQQQLIGVILVFQNVTEQYAINHALRVSEQRFRDVIEASGSYIWEINRAGQYTYLSENVKAVKGYTAEQLTGRQPFEFISPADRIKVSQLLRHAIKNKTPFELTAQTISPEKTLLWEEIKAQVVTDKQGKVTGFRGVGMNANQRKKDQAEIEHLAYYDALTSLPNRRMLTDKLKHELAVAIRHGTFGALLFLDLDHFKNINDSLGHAVGDELLVQVAQRLTQQLRKEDIAARLGGDEFIILLSQLSHDSQTAITQARHVTEKVLTLLREPYILNHHPYFSSSSIGITLFPDADQEDEEIILKQADTALYQAKELGRNTFQFYCPTMHETASKRLEMEKNLRTALQENQLELYYQPQMNHLNQLIGAEVLLRWFLPNKGMIPPDQFIPVAEEAGLIVDIGQWIFRETFKQAKQWFTQGLLESHQHISINISPKQFKQTDFVQQLIDIVEETKIDPQNFILEVTEGIFLKNIDDTIEKMLHLRGLGFTFSIDDFGTGYSSLSYLKRLPLKELKIDKAFVDDLLDDTDDQVIVETIISMAKHLQFSVIAEGVENKQQLEYLKQQGCLHYQGYFFSKPLNKKDFETYARQYAQ